MAHKMVGHVPLPPPIFQELAIWWEGKPPFRTASSMKNPLLPFLTPGMLGRQRQWWKLAVSKQR